MDELEPIIPSLCKRIAGKKTFAPVMNEVDTDTLRAISGNDLHCLHLHRIKEKV